MVFLSEEEVNNFSVDHTETVYKKVCKDPKCNCTYWTTSRNQKYHSVECQERMKVVVKKKSARKAKRRAEYDENAEINRTLSSCYTLAHKVADLYKIPRRCTCHGKGCNGPLQLHHKDGNPFNNSPWNLEWLCASHHKRLHDTIPDINMVVLYNQCLEEAKFADENGRAQFEAKVEIMERVLSQIPTWDECVRRLKESIEKEEK